MREVFIVPFVWKGIKRFHLRLIAVVALNVQGFLQKLVLCMARLVSPTSVEQAVLLQLEQIAHVLAMASTMGKFG